MALWEGSAEGLEAQVASLAERLRGRRVAQGRLPLSTGSLSVDNATGMGGLPRQHVIGLSAPRREAIEPLLLSTMSEASSSGGIVAVIDSTGRIGQRFALTEGVLGPQVVLIKPRTPLEGLRLAARLAERGLVDLLIIDLDQIGHQAATHRGAVSRSVKQLANVAHRSTAAVLLLHPSPLRKGKTPPMAGALSDAEDFRIRVHPKVKAPSEVSGRALVEVALGERGKRKAHIEIQPDLTLSRDSELLEFGLSEGVIERAKRRYVYGDLDLGISLLQAKAALGASPDDRLKLESMLERLLETQREQVARTTLQDDARREASEEYRSAQRVEQIRAQQQSDRRVAERFEAQRMEEQLMADRRAAEQRSADRLDKGRKAERLDKARRGRRAPAQVDDRRAAHELETGREPLPPPDSYPADQAPSEVPPEAPSSPRQLTRFVNTWLESDSEPVLPLIRDMSVTFALNIGPKREKPGAGATDFVEPDFGNRTHISLVVSMRSEDFWIELPDHSLALGKVGATETARTRVVPLRQGDCSIAIAIALHGELELLQRLVVSVPVVERARVSVPGGS